MPFIMNLTGQVNQMRLPKSKALWPLFETVVNSIQSLEDTDGCTAPQITIRANRIEYAQVNTDGADELSHFETLNGWPLKLNNNLIMCPVKMQQTWH